MDNNTGNIIRAFRPSFLTASLLPFVFGSLLWRGPFNIAAFLLGVFCVITTHLSANLINDYADSRSGADWCDMKFYKFFGGSKLIQEGKLSEKFYLHSAAVFAVLSFLSVMILSLILKSFLPAALYLIIITLSWSYSEKPLQFSYRRMGEAVIFLLFGPVPVMGGYFIQSHAFPEPRSFMLSLPFGFLTAAILFANEVPDFSDDLKSNKFTWVSISGPQRSFLIYYLLIAMAFASVLFGIYLNYLKPIALVSLIAVFPALGAGAILKKYHADKLKLTGSSKLTIACQTLTGIFLIVSVLL